SMPGTAFLIAVSITVAPISPSTVREVPSKSINVILGMENGRGSRSGRGNGAVDIPAWVQGRQSGGALQNVFPLCRSPLLRRQKPCNCRPRLTDRGCKPVERVGEAFGARAVG